MTSLTDDAYVGTLHYKKLEPPVKSLEERFIADTNITKGEVVQLKTNGNIESITGTDIITPAFPVAPFQQFVGTGGTPQAHTSVLYTSELQVLIGYENTSLRNVNLVYGDIDKTATSPFTFKTPKVIYQAPGSNTILYQRSILDADFRDPTSARGVCIWAETGSGATVGTYIVPWIYTYAGNNLAVGTNPTQVSASAIDFDATYINGSAFTDQIWIITSNNLLLLAELDYGSLIATIQSPSQQVDSSLTTLINPRITDYEGNNGLYVMCFYSNGATPLGRSIQIDAYPTFTLGAVGVNTTTGALFHISKKRDGTKIYCICNQSSPGVGFTVWDYDESSASFTISTSTNVSSGNPAAIEYLNANGTNYLVWFSEGYISNLPFAGFYNLDTNSNAPFTLTASSPCDFGAIGVIEQDLDIVYAWQGPGDGRAALCNLGNRTTNLNASRIIGIADEDGVIGQQIRVAVLGSVGETNVDTLAPLEDVYVEFDGTISKTPVIGDVRIGKGLTTRDVLLSTEPQTI